MYTETPSSAETQDDQQRIRDRILRGIAGNRVPGLHFPGHFLGLTWSDIGKDSGRLTIADGPHCRNAQGVVDVTALALIADAALGTPIRLQLEDGVRLATLRMHLQFTGVPARGDIVAHAKLLDSSTGGKLKQWMATCTLAGGGTTLCHASGEFAELRVPEGVQLEALPWERREPPVAPLLDLRRLGTDERHILRACERALARATPYSSFIEHLWSGPPRRTASGASSRVAIGPQIGNRVGHVQGGILLGIAANSACAAAPSGMMLSGVSAWYLSPGRGTALHARSRLVHGGRTVAVVRTELKASNGVRVLETITHHVAHAHD
jgi:acyl-coenzyme A thioesterase PaaI-like protein